jgi:hypothetical protein
MELSRCRVRQVVLYALIAMLAGCSTTRTPLLPEQFPEERRPVADLVKSLARREGEFKSLRSLASVYYSGPDGKQNFQEIVVVSRPDRLRLETLYPLGVLMIVTASPQELTGYQTREGVFYHGKSSRENLWRFTQIPLSVTEAASLLIGLPPRTDGEWRHDGPSIVRDSGGGWKEAVTFHPAEPLPIRWQLLNPSGGIEMAAEFADYTTTPAGSFPMRIALETPAQKRRLEIAYKEPELNIDLAPALFVQKKPNNAREVALDLIGG